MIKRHIPFHLSHASTRTLGLSFRSRLLRAEGAAVEPLVVSVPPI